MIAINNKRVYVPETGDYVVAIIDCDAGNYGSVIDKDTVLQITDIDNCESFSMDIFNKMNNQMCSFHSCYMLYSYEPDTRFRKPYKNEIKIFKRHAAQQSFR